MMLQIAQRRRRVGHLFERRWHRSHGERVHCGRKELMTRLRRYSTASVWTKVMMSPLRILHFRCAFPQVRDVAEVFGDPRVGVDRVSITAAAMGKHKHAVAAVSDAASNFFDGDHDAASRATREQRL